MCLLEVPQLTVKGRMRLREYHCGVTGMGLPLYSCDAVLLDTRVTDGAAVKSWRGL